MRAPEPSPAQVERTLKLTAGARRARAGSDATDVRASSSAPNAGGGFVSDWAALERPLFAVAAAPASAAEADPRGGYGGAITRRVNPVFEGPAPWTGAELPESADLGAVRTQLTDRLYALRDAAPSRADWRFVDRIMRPTAAPRLDFPLFPDAAIKLDVLLRSGDPPRAEVSALVRQEPALVQRV